MRDVTWTIVEIAAVLLALFASILVGMLAIVWVIWAVFAED